jgi:hypothetical protein
VASLTPFEDAAQQLVAELRAHMAAHPSTARSRMALALGEAFCLAQARERDRATPYEEITFALCDALTDVLRTAVATFAEPGHAPELARALMQIIGGQLEAAACGNSPVVRFGRVVAEDAVPGGRA